MEQFIINTASPFSANMSVSDSLCNRLRLPTCVTGAANIKYFLSIYLHTIVIMRINGD